MLRSVSLTQHKCIERWNHWVVAVPDDMDDDTIAGIMEHAWKNGDLDLVIVEESDDENDLAIDISDVPPNAETPDIALTKDGDVIEEGLLAAFYNRGIAIGVRSQASEGRHRNGTLSSRWLTKDKRWIRPQNDSSCGLSSFFGA